MPSAIRAVASEIALFASSRVGWQHRGGIPPIFTTNTLYKVSRGQMACERCDRIGRSLMWSAAASMKPSLPLVPSVVSLAGPEFSCAVVRSRQARLGNQ
jgi:hypothetical protein